MTIQDIKNAGYHVFKADEHHSYNIYMGRSYHGVVSIEGKNKFFRVTLIEDCPLYNVKIRVNNVDELAAAIKQYFNEGDTYYYDMYNVQIVEHYRIETFVASILKKYGFDYAHTSSWDENVTNFKHDIGYKRSIIVSVNTKTFEMHGYFGSNTYTTDTFKMWDEDSVKTALSNVLTIPIITEIGSGLDLLTKFPMATKNPDIKSNALEMFGEKKDDIKKVLENARDSINQFLATL